MTKSLIKDLTNPGLGMFYGENSERPDKARIYLSTQADAYTIQGFKSVVHVLSQLTIDIKHKEADLVELVNDEPIHLDYTMFAIALTYPIAPPRLLTITLSQDKQSLTFH